MNRKTKRLIACFILSLLMACMMATTAFAAGTGDVAGAVESTYHPNSRDYQKLTDAVSDYLEVFQEQSQTADQQWQQTM